MNNKAFLIGYLYKESGILGSAAKTSKGGTKAKVAEEAAEAGSGIYGKLLAALGIGGTLGAGAGYGAAHLKSPSQIDINNEVRKMELAEANDLLETLKAHRSRGEAPDAGKSLYI